MLNIPTISESWANYLADRFELAEGSVLLVEDAMKKLVKMYGNVLVTEIDHDKAEAWKRHLRIECKLSLQTIARHLRTARSVFAREMRRKAIAANPFADVKVRAGCPDREWETITEHDLDLMLAVAGKRPTAAQQWQATLAICRLAGLRRGEAMRLEWPEIDWTARTMTVKTERGYETTKQRRRVVPIVPKLYSLLWGWFGTNPAGQRGPCHGLPFSNLQRNADTIVETALGKTYDKPFHTLRKNCESDWLSKHPIMDVCKWLGHSPAVAMKHYHQTTAQSLAIVTGVQAKAS